MRSDVSLRPLDEDLLLVLLSTAVDDADPADVMPPVPDPAGDPGWTDERRAAFLRFHRERCLSAEPVESTYAITAGDAVVGAARLCPVASHPERRGRAVEAGVWIGRSHRGTGVGGAVLGELLTRARAAGFDTLIVSTTEGNTELNRLLSAWGLDLVREGDAVSAHVDLTVPEALP